MPWHKPRFRLVHLILLIAVVAVELAAIRAPLSWVLANLSVIAVMINSCAGPLTAIEWFGIVSVHIFTWGLFFPLFESLNRIS